MVIVGYIYAYCRSTELGSGAFRAFRLWELSRPRDNMHQARGGRRRACVAAAWSLRRARSSGEREAKRWPDPECTHLGAILRRSGSSYGHSEKGFAQGHERFML